MCQYCIVNLNTVTDLSVTYLLTNIFKIFNIKYFLLTEHFLLLKIKMQDARTYLHILKYLAQVITVNTDNVMVTYLSKINVPKHFFSGESSSTFFFIVIINPLINLFGLMLQNNIKYSFEGKRHGPNTLPWKFKWQ